MITAGLVPGTLGLQRVAGISIGFAGVVLLVAPWNSDLRPTIGVPLILLAAVGYAGGFVFMTRRLIPTSASPGELAALQMTTSALLLLVPTLLWQAPSRISVPGAAAVVALGLVCTALTFAVVYRMLAADGATRTSVVGYLIPLVAVVLGVALRGEALRWTALAGAVVVLAGVALTRRSSSRGRRDLTETPGTSRPRAST
jgi:drug/metabolite transporter (DMT)-like permease